jgi:LCP family protein required for cell wall assembly
MNPSGRKLWWVLGGVFLAALALLAIILYPEAKKRWLTPLEPGPDLPSITPALAAATDTFPAPSPLASKPLETLATEALTATVEPAETPQALCGGPESMTILVVGNDSRSDYLYGLADAVRIVRVDFVTPQVNVFALPRDLWVEIPGLEEERGITHGKLNQAYFYGTPGMGYYDGPGEGAGLLARALEENFGLHIDHHVVVNMPNFVRIVDTIGGFDINLPSAVDGLPFEGNPINMGYFPAGQQHLNGEQALRLVRIRQKYNDFIRMENQSRVICALKERITSPEILPKIPQLIQDLRDAVLTDFTPEQMAQLACLAPELEAEDLLLTGLPQEMFSLGHVYSPQLGKETSALEADFDEVQDYAGQFMAGSWPMETDETACP